MPDHGPAFTLARWEVKPGKEEAFIAAWTDLSQIFAELKDPPLWGTLLRSDTDPLLFYSFGPWRDPTHIAQMRADPATQAGFDTIARCCTRMDPGSYSAVRHVSL